METLTKYILSPVGGLYLINKACKIFSTFFFTKKERTYTREYIADKNIMLKNVSQDYGKKLLEDKDTKYIFVINIDEFSNDDDASSIFAMSSNKSNKNFQNISKIVDFILLNLQPHEQIILNVDSPGGSVIEYFYVYNQLKRLKDKGYTLNIFVKKMAASGGYLISCLGNITATNDSQIGSIGVYSSGFNYNELLKFLKIGYKLYKSGELKNLGDPYDVPSEDADKKLQNDVINIHNRFKKAVNENRKNINIDQVASAELWFADEAKELGLIDNIGTINDYLIEKAKEYVIYELSYKIEKEQSSMGWLDLITKLNR